MSYCGTFVNRPYHVFSVTPCIGVKNALDRLRKDKSRFHSSVVLQQPTNDVPEAKRYRFKWSTDKQKIFIDCVEELKKKGIACYMSIFSVPNKVRTV